MKHESASISFGDYREMIQQAPERLPESVKVVLLADRGVERVGCYIRLASDTAFRGFVHTDLMQMLTTQLGWHYRIRTDSSRWRGNRSFQESFANATRVLIKSNTWVWRGNWCQPQSFHLHLGQVICLHNVQIHKGEFYGRVHVIIGRNNINGELWAIVSNEKTTLQTFAEYGLRFDIVRVACPKGIENFLDDQSGGWNIQRSMIRDGECFIPLVVYSGCDNSLRQRTGSQGS